MDKILTRTIREEDMSSTANGVVNLLLKKCLHLTGREVSRAKFTPEGITADGQMVTICDRLVPGQTLRIVLADSAEVSPTSSRPSVVAVPGDLDILYEDEDVIVLNKPAGKVVHPSHGHWLDSMANHLAAYYQTQGLNGICYTIGRLDKDTSGALLFAKNRPAAARLTAQRSQQMLHRTYLALTDGIPQKTISDIDLPMGPDTDTLQKQRIYRDGEEGGRSALTHYTLHERGRIPGTDRTFSLAKVTIDTGRTHQIRLHMAAIGKPLLGDSLYNPRCFLPTAVMQANAMSHDAMLPNAMAQSMRLQNVIPSNEAFSDSVAQIKTGTKTTPTVLSSSSSTPVPHFQRAALHAENISFTQPFTGESLCIHAPLPEDFTNFLAYTKQRR